MSHLTTRSKALAVGVLCAAGGVGAGAVATAGASTSSTSHASKTHHARKAEHPRGHDLRGLARHSVSGNVVVHTKDGFKTISFERGKVDSVSGDQLTLTEGTAKASYKTETITILAGAKVRDNRKPASLSSVTAGQRVLVVQGPKHTIVRAHTPKPQPAS